MLCRAAREHPIRFLIKSPHCSDQAEQALFNPHVLEKTNEPVEFLFRLFIRTFNTYLIQRFGCISFFCDVKLSALI